jgi:hypothetical protein
MEGGGGMKKKVLSTVSILTIIFSFLLLTHQTATATQEFMDGRLSIQGYVRETMYYMTQWYERQDPYRDNRLDFLQTQALLKVLYRLKEGEGHDDLTVRLYGGVKWWWQKALMLDDQYRRSIPHRDRKDWTHPRSFEDDILTEVYVDIIKDPWQLRVGKQIVIWGQLSMNRVADVVNPLDIRRGFPGQNPWDDIKVGLWMIRAIYESELPGNLLFETIFNPGDFEPMQIPLEGTHAGIKAWNVRFFDPYIQKYGIFHWQREKMYRDAPGWSRSNWELGLRVRGNTLGVDWTLLYWNARDDGPVMNPGRGYDFTMIFIDTAQAGKGLHNIDWPSYKVFHYKRYTTVGGTAQVFVPQLWDTVWRTEWFVEINRPLNKATHGDRAAIYGWTRRTIWGAALEVSKALNIPWFTSSRIACNRMLDVRLTYFREQVMNHDHDLTLDTREYAWTNSTNDSVILFMKQDMFNSRVIFVCTANYYLRTKKWMAVPSFGYVFPGIHWRFDLGYAAYGGPQRRWVASSDKNDKLVMRVRYEF